MRQRPRSSRRWPWPQRSARCRRHHVPMGRTVPGPRDGRPPGRATRRSRPRHGARPSAVVEHRNVPSSALPASALLRCVCEAPRPQARTPHARDRLVDRSLARLSGGNSAPRLRRDADIGCRYGGAGQQWCAAGAGASRQCFRLERCSALIEQPRDLVRAPGTPRILDSGGCSLVGQLRHREPFRSVTPSIALFHI